MNDRQRIGHPATEPDPTHWRHAVLAAIVGAIQTVLSAILTVVTLPFRLVARLFGGAKRRA